MKKQRKQLITMAVFLGFLIVAYITLGAYNEEQAKKEEQNKENETFVVTDFDYEDVVAFSYNYEEEKNSFTKSGDEWSYDGDTTFDVDESLIEDMLSDACSVIAQDYVDAYESLDNYGLDTPQKTVCLTFADGSTANIQIGNYNDMIGYYYLMVDGDTNLYLVDSTLWTAFEVSYTDLEYIEEVTEEQ